MASAARHCHRSGHTCLSHWTDYWGKGIAARVGPNRCGSACARASHDICHRVFRPRREFLEGAERYSSGIGASAGGDAGSARIPCAPFGEGQDLSLSNLQGSHLPTFSGAIRLALSVSAGGGRDGDRRRLWWLGNTISLRSRRSIRSAGKGIALRSNVRKIFSSSWERAGGRARLYRLRLWVSAPHGKKPCGYVHSRGQGDVAG